MILLDPHEAGGLWQTVKAAAIAESVGIPVTLHSGGELALSQAAYLHLAASIPNMTLAIDTELTHLAGDVIAGAVRVDGGTLAVPARPGPRRQRSITRAGRALRRERHHAARTSIRAARAGSR